MPLITWNDTLSVGVASIDAEHQELVGLLNAFYEAMQAKDGVGVLGNTLDALIEYTKFHFANEERLFAKTGYPDAVAHKKEHDKLAQQVLEVQARYKAGQTDALSLEVVDFLKRWLVNHIQGTDKRYRPHLVSHGVQ